MTVRELKDFMWESNFNNHRGRNERISKALTMMDSILFAFKVAFPETSVKLGHDTCGEHIYMKVNEKVLDIDVLDGTVKEEKN